MREQSYAVYQNVLLTCISSNPLWCSSQGGLSVDSISDLVESQSRLLEALQLSHPAELELKKSPGGRGSSEGRTQTKLSLNPIYRQVPRVLERCSSHIENHGETLPCTEGVQLFKVCAFIKPLLVHPQVFRQWEFSGLVAQRRE